MTIDLDAARKAREAARPRLERLGHKPAAPRAMGTVRHECYDCGRSLRCYFVVRTDKGIAPVIFPLSGRRQGKYGISTESHEGRAYIRVRCKCGRNQKIPLADYSPGVI